ncbi:DUF2244 domain-containing protein [Ancylobacter pratisalsi]|uniref:DUF2244 domain-containing protein n=1 Tax=Ancylobacter pratisalsi TaxID=1745854 RepID=A0A6P1YR47_9HYPH|nr:DUF2244 domain-containing protein [Ancylobacter pratisalsi]QIB34214.1 DUF2244 domain-containing protein [Ancylobacter pratisalsi]
MSTAKTVPPSFGHEAHEPTLYQARLEPYRSLDRRGFVIVMVVVAAISFVCGTAFLLMGAWPVFGVFGLDVLAIWWAFRMNFNAARAREEITVTPSLITVVKVDPAGRADEARMNPLWTRLDRETMEDYGLQRLALRSRGDVVEVGGFLHTAQREELAEGLSFALGTAKRGVVRSTP